MKMSMRRIKRFLLGNPLHLRQMEHEKLPKWKALAVFSSDALSSVAYATEEILLVLTATIAGAAAATWSIPIAATIVGLIFLVTISYKQTVRFYPQGGGAYNVAKDNFGTRAGLLAGAALALDYVLTVAVSVSAGVAAISSAFPMLKAIAVPLGVTFVVIISILNLRGMKESSFIFAIPTYMFIFSIFALIIIGGVQAFNGVQSPKLLVEETQITSSVGIFLLLRAFASGCTALTGIEAISNGVPAFKEPRTVNARKTLTIMVTILSFFFFGITFLAIHFHALPNPHETVISQIARSVVGEGFFYYWIQTATCLILILAANTAYADFPRLASILAQDRYFPRQFAAIGDRLVFSNGIIVLGGFAAFLIWFFNANTHALIPMYSVGVFISFTLSQAGMTRHHWRIREKHWKYGLVLNALGAFATGVVAAIVAITKFTHGAWFVMLILPLLMLLFRSIRKHYDSISKELVLPSKWSLPVAQESLVIIPISGFHQGVLQAIQYAKEVSKDIRLCIVNINEAATQRVKQEWERNVDLNEVDVPKLVILESPYRSVIYPLLDYMNEIEKSFPNRTITVMIPEFITQRFWHNLLHNQTALMLRARLRFDEKRVVISIGYHLKGG
jgi:amino acid transporter